MSSFKSLYSSNIKLVYNKLDNLVNLVSRISFGKGLDDVNLLDSTADEVNQNVISRCQSMMINKEQHLINDDQEKEIHSFTDESTCYKWVE